MEEQNQSKHELFSTSVKAGKRTYFFDVKLTRNKDYFLTISERKKKFNKYHTTPIDLKDVVVDNF